MPSVFDNAFTGTINAAQFTLFGEAGTYRASESGAAAQNCTVIIQPEADTVISTGTDTTVIEARVKIWVRATEITPARYGAFTVGSITYIVEATPTARAGVYECDCRVRARFTANDRRRE